jgi:hypothetical protein
MRELTVFEIEEVSGGDFVSAFGYGMALGGASYGGLVMAAGYAAPVIVASFTYGMAYGGIYAGVGFGAYYLANRAGLGRVGSRLGTWAGGGCS